MENDRILQNNRITHFILRVDLLQDTQIDYKQLADSLKGEFETYKTELHFNYNVDIDKVEVKKEDFIKYLLSTPTVNLKIDSFEKCITIELQQYIDKTSYVQYLTKVIDALKSLGVEIYARRIGMRYINVFSCSKIAEISKLAHNKE